MTLRSTMGWISWRKHIQRTVLLLGMVSLLNDLSGEIIMAVLPLFISQLGGGGIIIGLIGGLEEAMKSMLSVFSGVWSDRVRKRKTLVFVGYAFASLVRLLLGVSSTWVHALVLRMLDRVGKGIRTPARDAMIADAVPREHRGINFGFHRTMDTTGAILGSLTALCFFWVFSLDLRAIVLVGGVFALLSLIPLLFVKEKPPAEMARPGSWWSHFTELSPTFRACLWAMTLFALANFSYMFFLLKVYITLAPEGTEPSRLSLGLPIAMYVLYNVVYALFAAPVGLISDRLGRRSILITGYLVFSVATLGFAFACELWHFTVLFALYGMAYALIEANQRAFAADLSAAETRGTALGVFHMSVGLGAVAGGLISGALWQLVDPSAAFLYGGVLAVLGALALAMASRHAQS